ncbi:MAG TPA: GAF domain-containing sensor histidine kinase [Gemmatimonadaceae bacterium]|nr:GAF domain-containing sensor histidine kinase [Gemmatimonadaceae bacterium]
MTESPSTPAERGGPPAAGDVRLRELMAVREIVRAFLTADRPEDVFQFALDRVSPLVGASFACVYLIDGESELMRLAAVHNWPARYAPFLGEMRVRVGFGPSGQAAGERRPIEVADVFADHALEDWQEVAEELGFRALVALPLQTSAGVLGTVTFYFAEAWQFDAGAQQLLRTVADQMAATAEKARLIEDLRRANAHLADSNVELERQNVALIEARRVKDEFLANISHELRTPLTAVIGYISLMQEGIAGPVTDEQQSTLAQVKGSSEQLLRLIDDLLELTTMRRGGLEIEATTFDPREPLREAVREAQASLRSPSPAVTVELVEPDIMPAMRSDRKKIAKVLATLVGNALKFTAAGRVTASVALRDGTVVYRVEDTGIGIPIESQDLVFEEFRQVDGSMTRRHGGSGLGLALARRLARLLSGDVTLSSEPGRGSVFELALPLEGRGERGEA